MYSNLFLMNSYWSNKPSVLVFLFAVLHFANGSDADANGSDVDSYELSEKGWEQDSNEYYYDSDAENESITEIKYAAGIDFMEMIYEQEKKEKLMRNLFATSAVLVNLAGFLSFKDFLTFPCLGDKAMFKNTEIIRNTINDIKRNQLAMPHPSFETKDWLDWCLRRYQFLSIPQLNQMILNLLKQRDIASYEIIHQILDSGIIPNVQTFKEIRNAVSVEYYKAKNSNEEAAKKKELTIVEVFKHALLNAIKTNSNSLLDVYKMFATPMHIDLDYQIGDENQMAIENFIVNTDANLRKTLQLEDNGTILKLIMMTVDECMEAGFHQTFYPRFKYLQYHFSFVLRRYKM